MTTWIFMRGLTRASGHWGHFVDEFREAVPGSTVKALDLPGNGLLNHQRSPLSVHSMVAHCRAQLVACDITPPFHLLAMSLGGMVAVAWAQEHPNDVAGNVLINTSMRPFSPFYQRLLPANYVSLLRAILLNASPEAWERTVLRLTSNLGESDVLADWLALHEKNPVSRANAVRQLIAAARYRAPTAKPATPTLLLTSEHDHLVSVACSRALARHWQCTLHVHPNAGHDLPLDDPIWVIQQAERWATGLHTVD
ncbi:MAG TPA: alpha/beta hydrolase [Burkholderiaceae bacterium]|nr:alpha/beta hydrolase [Burkholderiaceae bacterium]